MAALLEQVANPARPFLWLDDAAYSERLFGGGRTNWFDTAEFVAYRRKAAGLLRPDVTALAVGTIAQAWVERAPELREAMAAKKRVIVPLRTLLADEDLRAKLVELVRGLRANFQNPLALTMPSPRKWVSEACRLAFGPDAAAEVSGDDVDNAAVYIAEFLRTFSESRVDVVLLEEPADAEPLTPAQGAWYQPVINLAGHYRWDLGLYLPGNGGISGEIPGIAFAIASSPVAGCVSGIITPAAFWAGEAPPAVPRGGFRFAQIPADSVPERVLERLAVLRGGA